MAKTPTIQFKRGDDFKLDLTVTDTNNTEAVAAAAVLVTAQETYDLAVAADPQVPQDIVHAQSAVDAAQAAYDLLIIVDITDWTITVMMAWSGTEIAVFTVTIINELLGTFMMSATAAQTALWVPRTYDADIQFVRPEGKTSSETFAIKVEKDITSG